MGNTTMIKMDNNNYIGITTGLGSAGLWTKSGLGRDIISEVGCRGS